MVEPYETTSAANNAADNEKNNEQDYTDELIKNYTLKTLNDTEEIWYYDIKLGIFIPNAEPIIKAKIESDKGMPYMDIDGKIKESNLTTYAVKEYINHIQRRTYIS